MNQYPNQPGGMPPVPPPYPGPVQQPASGLATASMVIGIISLVAALGFFWIPVLPQVLAVIGLILGIVAKHQGNQSGASTAGIVLSGIALAWSLIWFIACYACAAWFWHTPWYMW